MEAKTRITERKGDNEFPLVLEIELEEGTPSYGMSYSLVSRIKVTGKAEKTIDGRIENAGMRSTNCLDDEDSSDYSVQAEQQAVAELEKYLAEKFHGSVIKGRIIGTWDYIYNPAPRVYEIGERKIKNPEPILVED